MYSNINREDVTIGSSYYQMLGRVDCIANNLKSVRLETKRDNYSMILFACFLLASAQKLQIMRIQSFKNCCSKAWFAVQQNLLSQCHCASLEREVVIQSIENIKHKGFSIEVVDALADTFDSDINISIPDTLHYG
ncbi:hypothetical protein BAE44_0008783 [Dichanthelium oligosanthes]|uniref:Uncharacterized protein n=1 Tax=Dichanthelium oligosanthes TaxID=888268 RepID=A0A1E5VYL4_9POAL|nr:hypothetical protein BAE44_0008783 [Dichanthelium oligosanthes]